MSTRTQIWEAKDGWAPSRYVVRRLRAKAKAKGLISDWPRVMALESHDLLLSCGHVTGDFGADLIATKRSGQWELFTDTEYLEPGCDEYDPSDQD